MYYSSNNRHPHFVPSYNNITIQNGYHRALTVKDTVAAAIARNPNLAIPSENETNMLATPYMSCHKRKQDKTPAAPTRIITFLFQKASTCSPATSLYLEALVFNPSNGFLTTSGDIFILDVIESIEIPLDSNLVTQILFICA